jgi:beta-barrel assembly-enhancing protease
MLRSPLKPRRARYAILATVTAFSIAISNLVGPSAAQAFSWRDILPRIIPGIVETVQISSMSTKDEMAMGAQINAQLTQKQMRPLQDRDLSNYINEIGQRLARQSKRTDLTYTFQVVDDDNINAAATMGGYVYINKGTIKAAENEAQVASVIAHELAHIEGKHTIEQAKNDSLARTGAAALKLDKNTIVGLVAQYGMNMPRSRRFETNADTDGMRMLTQAGYDQQSMVEFMKKLDTGSAMPQWLGSHPQTQVRVTALQKLVKKSSGGDGTDAVAYARRVGKPIPAVSPNKVAAPPKAIAPAPKVVTPSSPKVVTPVPSLPNQGSDLVVPTE